MDLKPPNEAMEQLKRLVRKPLFWLIVIGVGLVAWINQTAGGETVEAIGYVLLATVVYFLPSIAARKKPNETTVFTSHLRGPASVGRQVALGTTESGVWSVGPLRAHCSRDSDGSVDLWIHDSKLQIQSAVLRSRKGARQTD